MKKTLLSLLLLSGIILFNRCSNEVDLYADYKEITIVYGLLDISDDTTWVKVTRAYSGPGNALLIAQNPDSSNFPYKLDVTITGRKQGENLPTVQFDTITITEVLEHLVNPEDFVEKAKDLLVENGTLIVTVPFGINDHIDHKKTYYFLDLYQMLYKYFDIQDVSILGKWIGFIAVKRIDSVSENLEQVNVKLIKSIEEAFYSIERELVDNNKGRFEKSDLLQKKLKDATKQAVQSLEYVGKTAERNGLEGAVRQSLKSLGQVGITAAESGLGHAAADAAMDLRFCGRFAIEKGNKGSAKRVIWFLEKIGTIAAEKGEELEPVACQAAESLGLVGMDAIEKGKEFRVGKQGIEVKEDNNEIA